MYFLEKCLHSKKFGILSTVSCYESPRLFGDAAAEGVVTDRVRTLRNTLLDRKSPFAL